MVFVWDIVAYSTIATRETNEVISNANECSRNLVTKIFVFFALTDKCTNEFLEQSLTGSALSLYPSTFSADQVKWFTF